MKRLKFSMILMAFVLAVAMSASVSHAAPAGPSVSITNVLASPESVCYDNDTGTVDVSATVSATYDQSSTTNSPGTCSNIRCSGTSGPKNCSERTDSTTIVTVTPGLSVIASEGSNSATLSGTNGGTFTGSLSTTTTPDGKKTLSVGATASETITTQINTVTTRWGSTGSANTTCNGAGTQTGSTTGTPTTSTPRPASTSATGAYRVDLEGPTITVVTGVADIQQGQGLSIGLNADGGSSGAAYTATFTATNGSTTLGPFTESATFPTNKADSGVQGTHHIGPVSLSTSCSTPAGLYTLTAQLDSNDLCGNPEYSTSDNTKTFQVTPGFTLESQTLVISEIPPTGEYGIDQCFLSKLVNRKINNEPGYVHIAEVVTSAGPCAGLMDLTGVNLTLTLPADFSYAAPGKSPAAHIFVFQALTGFDYHYPPNEVTSLVTQSRSGQNLTIDLSGLDVGYGPGVIPSSWTIYARAKAGYSGTLPAAAEGQFVFSSSATAAGGLTASSDYAVVSNPTQGCVEGNFPTP